MDMEAKTAFFRQLTEVWVEPELARRRALGELPADFRVFRARILLPKNAPPIVAFNDDIDWTAWMDVGDSSKLKPGDVVYWDQVKRVSNVGEPLVDGQRVAFVYLFKVTKGYQYLFDLSPNLPDELRAELEVPAWSEPSVRRSLRRCRVG